MRNIQPELTVLMTVYNGEKTIRRALESIFAQTYPHFEFLIIDDGSTDNTVDIIQSYSDKRIQLHRNTQNLGQTKSLNVGLNLAASPYIARMDVDDISFPNRLEKQIHFLSKNPAYAVVGTHCLVIDEFGHHKRISRGCVSQEDVILRLLHGSPLNHVSVLMQTDVIRKVGGYNTDYLIGADFDLWSRLVRQGYKITTLPDVLMSYTQSRSSYSQENISKKNQEVAAILLENYQTLSEYPIEKADAVRIMRFFYEDLTALSKKDIKLAQSSFKNLALNIESSFSKKISKRKINKLLLKNHWITAYHLMLEDKFSAAREHIRECLSTYRFDMQTFALYAFTYLHPKVLKKINYIRSKYF